MEIVEAVGHSHSANVVWRLWLPKWDEDDVSDATRISAWSRGSGQPLLGFTESDDRHLEPDEAGRAAATAPTSSRGSTADNAFLGAVRSQHPDSQRFPASWDAGFDRYASPVDAVDRTTKGKALPRQVTQSFNIKGEVMNTRKPWVLIVALAVVCSIGLVSADSAKAGNRRVRERAMMYPWHGGYYHSAWGMPVALVVPPTAERQTNWGWGVGNTRCTPIDHQFHRNYPGPVTYDARGFRPTPRWPSDTSQFGVYYVRGPW